MEPVLSMPISPFGTIDIFPEDICEILGLTVNGKQISAPPVAPGGLDFDWSGRTTYWVSTHRMMLRDDAETLVRRISNAFPGSVLLQPSWPEGPLKVRCRQIKFMMPTDTMVSIGVDCDKSRLDQMLAAEEVPTEEFNDVIGYRINLIRADHEGEDMTLKRHIDARGARKLDLDYEVIHHRRYRITTEYATDDARAQSIERASCDPRRLLLPRSPDRRSPDRGRPRRRSERRRGHEKLQQNLTGLVPRPPPPCVAPPRRAPAPGSGRGSWR